MAVMMLVILITTTRFISRVVVITLNIRVLPKDTPPKAGPMQDATCCDIGVEILSGALPF